MKLFLWKWWGKSTEHPLLVQHNAHWYNDSEEQGATRLMVWSAIWKDRIIGRFFFNEHVNGEACLRMLEEETCVSWLDKTAKFVYWQ
jgi:hypothetical protein